MNEPAFVKSYLQVVRNIKSYATAVTEKNRHSTELAARVKRHSAWYAIKEDGHWLFGPSKFVGYEHITAERYLDPVEYHHGSRTENVLKKWFTVVEANSALGRELETAFIEFISDLGKIPNKNWRISTPRNELGSEIKPFYSNEIIDLTRIVFDAEICGGRPHIRGTRVRVSDIVEMLASGAERSEILADYPYLALEDISAALQYAASAINHRVVWAG